MNYSFFLILIAVVFVGFLPNISALETITTEYNFDTDNGDGTRTVRTHHPYIFDGNNWVPFIASGTQVQTHMGSVILNGTGYFQWNGKFNDSIKAKYADISDLNTWTYPNTLNNDTPDISWNGSQLVSEKNKAGVGNLKYKYVFDNGKWKTQLEVTNLSALNTKVFGFDQTINLNSDIIKFGGVTRNLDNFNGTSFDKEFLIANEGKVIDLLNGIAFDFDLGFENLNSITVYDTGINKSQLVFDYRTSEVLLPGETRIIDPTFNSGASTNDGVIFSTTLGGGACSTTYGGITTTANRNVKRDNGSVDDCQASYFNFDISGAGNITSVSSATIEFDIVTSTSPLNCDLIHKATVFQGDQDSWTALLSYTGATVVKNNVATCASGVANGYVVAFDSNIYPLIVADANSDGTVSIGVGFDNWARDATTHRFDFRNNDAVLEFVYNPVPEGTFEFSIENVGDAIQVESIVNVTGSSTFPVNATALKLYKNNSLVQSDSILVTIASANLETALDDLFYQITDDASNEYAVVVTLENTAGTADLISGTNVTMSREYNPDYFTATDPTQGLVNYTLPSGNLLNVNRDTNSSAFNIECRYLTQSQAFLNDVSEGTWDNETNVIFYVGDTTGKYAVECFNDGELFAIIIPQNYTNALVPGLLIFDQLGGFFGAPSIILVIISILSLGTGRNYPIVMLIAASVTGILLALELLTLDPGLVVALIVMTGFGLFGIRKFY